MTNDSSTGAGGFFHSPRESCASVNLMFTKSAKIQSASKEEYNQYYLTQQNVSPDQRLISKEEETCNKKGGT